MEVVVLVSVSVEVEGQWVQTGETEVQIEDRKLVVITGNAALPNLVDRVKKARRTSVEEVVAEVNGQEVKLSLGERVKIRKAAEAEVAAVAATTRSPFTMAQ